MSRKIRGMARIMLLPLLLAVVAVPLTLERMERQDARHASFYQLGSGINSFLKDYCKGVEKAFAAGDPAPMAEFYDADFASPGRGRWQYQPATQEGPVTVSRLRQEGSEDGDQQLVLAEMGNYLSSLSAVDKTICKINLIEEADLTGNVVLTVKYILGGVGQDGLRLEDRNFYRLNLVHRTDAAGGPAWRILRDELVEGVRVAGDGKTFEDVEAAELGIDYAHRRDPKLDVTKFGDDLEFGVIEHASGGVAARDVNGDGWPELFFADGVESKLYRHRGLDQEGRPIFQDITEVSGLDGIDQAHAGFFIDYDNDGDRDLVVTRYLAPGLFFEHQGVDAEGNVKFVDRSAESGLDLVVPATSGTFLDYDHDGDLDFYLGVYGNAFEEVPRLPFMARNGESNRLLRNDGAEGFTDVTEESGVGDTGWTLAVAAGDVDGDGWTDLGVANDFGRKSLYRNNGDGTFREIAKEAGVLDFSGGMGLTFTDFDGDGRLDLYTSNINSNQRWFGEDMTVQQYMRNVLRTRWALADAGEYLEVQRLTGTRWTELGQQIGEGNSLFRNRGLDEEGRMVFEELHDSDTHRAGWSWSVASFDYDNDADLDLYAANGWISNTPGTDL